ncbi:MAG: GAF domain-containing protein [Dehalococcoidia bacterium]|nr:GAF domain-containing protein [Dehalococcoidia bacterium]
MGEHVPGIAGSPALDAPGAQSAVLEAAGAGNLDAFLQRCTAILHSRFQADVTLLRIHRHARGLYWEPQAGPLAGDSIFPNWQTFRDAVHASRVASAPSKATSDIRLEPEPSPAQRACLEHGVHSAAWATLRDERGGSLGFIFVGAKAPGTFTDAVRPELEGLAALIAWQARPAILMEDQEAERRLLIDESQLLASIAEADSEHDLTQHVIDALRVALPGDLVIAFIDAEESPPAMFSSPAGALSAGQWAGIGQALAASRAVSVQERSIADSCFMVDDLAKEAPTQVERWIRDELGMRALAVANRTKSAGGSGLAVGVMRRQPGTWTTAECGFLSRITRVFELSIERLRRGELASERTERAERQSSLRTFGAKLLELVSTEANLEVSCNLMSARLRDFFAADHVAFGMLDLAAGTRTVLGSSSSIMERGEFTTRMSDLDSTAYRRLAESRSADYIGDMSVREDLNDAAGRLRARGMRSIMRAPFVLSDGSVGVVIVGSAVSGSYGAADAENLLDLCRPVGIAIDRVRLLAGMERTGRALDAQTHILSALVPGATAESAGEVFVNEITRLFGASHAMAAIVDEHDVRIVGIASEIVEPEGVRDLISATDRETEANWRRVMRFGEPQMVSDLATIVRTPAEDTLLAGGLRTMMRVPIRDSSGRVRGMVTAGSPDAGAWGDAELSTLGELAACLGLVFERADLYERAEQRSATIRALTGLLGTLSLNAQPEEVAQKFSSQVREYLGADAVVVYSFGPQNQLDRVAFDAGPEMANAEAAVARSEALAAGHVMTVPSLLYDTRDDSGAVPWLTVAGRAAGLASIACVRLDAGGETVGMVAAGSVQPEGVRQQELDILAAVAMPLGMVLERARALTSLRVQAQRTRAVLDILAALGQAGNFEEVAAPIASALRVMYSADHCAVSEYANGYARLAAADSSVTNWEIGHTLPSTALWGEGPPPGPVLHVIPDLAAINPLPETSERAARAGMRSSMRVLIGTPADPLGVVTVGSSHPGRFSDADARQLVQIVQPLAVSLRYFRGRRETELRTRRIETTNRILTRLGAGGAPEHLAAAFLAECRALFNCCHALAVRFEAETESGRILAVDSDLGGLEPLPSEFPLWDMHSARLVRQPTPHLIADAREEAVLNARHHHLIAEGVYSAVRAPLVVHDTVRGAVSLWGFGANAFTAEDAELLGTLTRPLALALEKASALESLGESELKYRSLVAQADEMIFLFEPVTLRILDANACTASTLGYEPSTLLTLTLDQMIEAPREEIEASVASAIAAGELHLTDTRFLRTDGSVIEVDAVASMVTFGGRQAVLVLARDVSERKALIRQLVQSQKMDSLGAMAGAVAHDFNNLLTTILGFAGLLKRSRNMDSEERENLALIEDAARRAADLTGRLLSFSRGGLVRFGKVNLRTVIEDTLQLAEPSMHSGITLTRELPNEPAFVEGDAGQIQQALTNIVLNARDAMPEGGSIRVTLAADGNVAAITIADTGPGMDEETRVRIFEPFYTTKPAGSGTGLGMAITYGIIQGHHGDISVESTPGRGTTFTITLPLFESAIPDPVDLFNAGEGNLVLVVDDDAMVRRTTTATLAELGYNVVEAPGGATAVEIMKARPDRFSVVLLDLVMPGMTGSETFRALTAIRPDLPVVVCTGYAADSHIDTDVKRRIAGLVQKPFTADRLSRALLAAGAQPARPARI